MFIYWAVIIGLVIVVLAQAESLSALRAKYELEIKENSRCECAQCPMCREEKNV